MRNKMRKQYQRALNHDIKNLNKNIAQDNLWRGRFYFFQKAAFWEEFPDHSGGLLRVYVRGYDKATGYYRDYILDYAPFLKSNQYHIWKIGNDFITEGVKVWNENPIPSVETAKDWTGVKVDTQEIGKYKFKNW